jgi:WD40 repeat protein
MIFELTQDFHDAIAAMPTVHPKHRILGLLEEAIRHDIHFIARHPTTMFQCMWNMCWWYDCPEAKKHYQGNYEIPQELNLKLSDLMQTWHDARQMSGSFPVWLRSHRPPPQHLGTAQRQVLKGHRDRIWSIAYSPDGTRLVSGSVDRTVRIWDVRNGKMVALLTGHSDYVMSVAYSPNGKYVASGSQDRTVRIWDAEIGTEIATFQGHEGWVNSLAFSPCGRYLASGGDKTVRLWDVEGRTPLGILGQHVEEVQCVAFEPDGKFIANGTENGRVHIWDIEKQTSVVVLQGHEGKVWSVAFSPDGHHLASGANDGTVRIWKLDDYSFDILEGHSGAVRSLAFSPDDCYVASGGHDRAIQIWDLGLKKQIRTFQGSEGVVFSVAFSPDSRYLASGDYEAIRIWDLKFGKELIPLPSHNGWVECVSFSPDGTQVVSGSDTIYIWDTQSGVFLTELQDDRSFITALVFSPDGKWFATGSEDKIVRVWNAKTGKLTSTLKGHEGKGFSIFFLSDCRRLITADGNSVRVWDFLDGTLLHLLQDKINGIITIALSPDEHSISVGGKNIYLCDMETGNKTTEMQIIGIVPTCLSFSPDSELIAAGTNEGSIRVWDVRTGLDIFILRGHKGIIEKVTFSPDGSLIVSSEWQEAYSVRMWDSQTGNCLRVLPGCSDVSVVAAGPAIYPYRAVNNRDETVVEDVVAGCPICWFPHGIMGDCENQTHPSGRIWAGCNFFTGHVYIITLEEEGQWFCQKNLEIAAKLRSCSPDRVKFAQDLVISYYKLACYHQDRNRNQEAHEYWLLCKGALEYMKARRMFLDAPIVEIASTLNSGIMQTSLRMSVLATVNSNASQAIFAEVRQKLTINQPSQALSLLETISDKGSYEYNAIAVCHLRLGNYQRAIDVLRNIIFVANSISMRNDVPTLCKVNFATALLMQGNIDGCENMLASLEQYQHPIAIRLKAAITKWQNSLSFWEKIGLRRSVGKPVIDFAPGLMDEDQQNL